MEANATGQLVDDAALYTKKALKNNVPAYALPYVYGIPAISKIKEDFLKIKAGEVEEVY